MIIVRPFNAADFPTWLPLWNDNNSGQKNEPVTTETWSRLIDSDQPVYGLGAFQKDTMIGLLHYILHPTTGSIEHVCYMQDVYVDPAHRRKGVARKLVKALGKIGEQEQWNRIYWLAENSNVSAQTLYKNIGVKLDFSFHVWPLSMLKK